MQAIPRAERGQLQNADTPKSSFIWKVCWSPLRTGQVAPRCRPGCSPECRAPWETQCVEHLAGESEGAQGRRPTREGGGPTAPGLEDPHCPSSPFLESTGAGPEVEVADPAPVQLEAWSPEKREMLITLTSGGKPTQAASTGQAREVRRAILLGVDWAMLIGAYGAGCQGSCLYQLQGTAAPRRQLPATGHPGDRDPRPALAPSPPVLRRD